MCGGVAEVTSYICYSTDVEQFLTFKDIPVENRNSQSEH